MVSHMAGTECADQAHCNKHVGDAAMGWSVAKWQLSIYATGFKQQVSM